MLLTLVDMALFGGFFGAAIAYRRRPEIHKRLILAATTALAFAAVGRMFESAWVFLAVWLAPLFGAMAFDVFSRGRVHPAYMISVAVLAAALVRVFYMESPGWLPIGRAILSPFL